MTNKEIKFELAKVALTTCRHMTSESLTESLNNLYDWITEEPVSEPVWSKEDEKTANNFISQLGNLCTRKLIKEETAYKYASWLKSLKNKVGYEANCTTTKEWSANGWTMQDEEELQIALDTLVKAGQHSSAKWLKNVCLRPQSIWKPSEEQIKVCKEVYADILSAKGFDLGTVNSELNRLEEELKKLREE